jgi:hypothetical protein
MTKRSMQQRLSRLESLRSKDLSHIICTLTFVEGGPETGPIGESCNCAEVDGKVRHRAADETLEAFSKRVRDDITPTGFLTLIEMFKADAECPNCNRHGPPD